MTKITAAEVNSLRKHTGAGMMDCKNALVECEGDFDKAVDFLRKKGQKVASKRADRDATEGVVIAKNNADNTYAAVVMVNCETDFVAKNQDFINYVDSIVDLAIANQAKNIDELKELDLNGRTVIETITDQTGVIGEKIELGIGTKTIIEGIEDVKMNTGFRGRWQVLSNNPLTISDVGHNKEGISQVVQQIRQCKFNKLHFVLGMVDDKDITDILNLLPHEAVYYFCKADIPRGMDEELLQEAAHKAGLNGKTYSSVREAYNVAVNNADSSDLVFIGGSTFVVAEIV